MNTTASTTHEWRFATDERPHLHLRSHRGDVRLSHDAGPGEVLVRLTSNAAFDPQQVETRTQGRDVYLTVPPIVDDNDQGFGLALQLGRLSWGIGSINRVDVEVHLSPDADVEVNAEGGDIISTGACGHVQLQTGGGDIRIDRATTGPVITRGGDIIVASLDQGELRTGGGDIRITRLGEGSIKTAGGDVRVDDLGSGRIETGGGDVTVHRTGGDVTVQTGGGDVTLQDCGGDTAVRTGAGDVTVEASGHVEVKTGAGDIRITVPRDIPVWQDLHSSFGEVRSRIAGRGEPAEGQEFIRVTARTGFGDVVRQD